MNPTTSAALSALQQLALTECARRGHFTSVRHIVVCFFACACGSVPFEGTDAGDDATSQDSAFGFGDGSTSYDAPTSDAPSISLEAGGAFLCHDCICDGTANYCEYVWAGASPSLLDDAGIDASACSKDAGPTECLPFFPDCLPTPTCACLLSHSGPGCECGLDTSGEGLVVECTYP